MKFEKCIKVKVLYLQFDVIGKFLLIVFVISVFEK